MPLKTKKMAMVAEDRIFEGNVDGLENREGYGQEMCCKRKGTENYSGYFKRDAFNGKGHYFAHNVDKNLWAYDGKFYSNSFTGYGTLSYGDATTFAGLFKNNKPYGPGVLTYANGRQDVGFWIGSQIYRLCKSVGNIDKLSITPADRNQVTKFKKLVIIEDGRDIATEVTMSIGLYETLKPVTSNLYSNYCKNPESYLFDHMYFNYELEDLQQIEETLYNKTKSQSTIATNFVNIDIVSTGSECSYISTNHLRKKTEILLLSWNNGNKVIEIMKHSFKYRHHEHASDYEMGQILCSRRKLFGVRGLKENASINILKASTNNDVKTILEMLHKHTLNIDVMDNKGNSMIMNATANDAIEVIKLLHILGADIDAVNDEGFSALTHTLSRYLAVKYDVTNWAQGFLPELNQKAYEDEENLFPENLKWMNDCMMSNASSNVQPEDIKKPRSLKPVSQKLPKPIPRTRYVFDLTPESRKSSEKTEHKRTHIMKLTQDDLKKQEIIKTERLRVIEKTAFCLLDIGADLHVSETPESIMVLAIFSGNLRIVEKLLQTGEDPNAMLSINNANLTPIHVIAQARPLPSYPAMVTLFIKYGANLALRTAPKYNYEEWRYLLDHIEDHDDFQVEGLTPLQIICMRSDATYVTDKRYLEQLCCILAGYTDQEERFLGLTPLGLAVSKGNHNIVLTLLNCSKVDVNYIYNHFWGNALSTYLRFHAFSGDPAVIEILRILILYGVDPLIITNGIKNEGNALNIIAQLKFKPVRKHTRKMGQSSVQSIETIKVEEKEALKLKKQLLVELAKLRLRKYIRGILARALLKFLLRFDAQKKGRHYSLLNKYKLPATIFTSNRRSTVEEPGIDSELEYTEVCKRAQEWMDTIDECHEILKKTIEKQKNICSQVEAITVISLLPELVIPLKKVTKDQIKLLKFLEGYQEKHSQLTQPLELNILERLRTQCLERVPIMDENLQWIQQVAGTNNKKMYIYPELDNDKKKYIVCYTCLKKSQNIQACPMCRLVFFCSMECNLLDTKKSDGYHLCEMVFWNLRGENFFSVTESSIPVAEESIKTPRRKSKRKSSLSLKRTELKDVLLREEKVKSQSVEEAKPRKPAEHKETTGQKTTQKLQGRSEEQFEDIDQKITFGRSSMKTKENKWSTKIRKSYRISKKAKNKLGFFKSSKSIRNDKSFKSIKRDREKVESAIKKIPETSIPTLGLNEIEEVQQDDNLKMCDRAVMGAKLLNDMKDTLEQQKLDVIKVKDDQDKVDIDFLGGIASPEEYWEKDKRKPYSQRQRFLALMSLLQKQFPKLFDIADYYPYVVFVDGNIYYKFYGEKLLLKKNYSFN